MQRVTLLRRSLVSLFPPTYKDRPNGNRVDIMELLAAMKPRFLRFPGGNYLEGPNYENRFNWKETIGPRTPRVPICSTATAMPASRPTTGCSAP